jgi:hypothetical protein
LASPLLFGAGEGLVAPGRLRTVALDEWAGP